MMKLSSLTRRENLYHCPYGDRREMADTCHYVWLRYFDAVVLAPGTAPAVEVDGTDVDVQTSHVDVLITLE